MVVSGAAAATRTGYARLHTIRRIVLPTSRARPAVPHPAPGASGSLAPRFRSASSTLFSGVWTLPQPVRMRAGS